MGQSISTKISLAAISLTMTVVLILGTASYICTRNILQSQLQGELSSHAEMTINRIESLLKGVNHDAQNMSVNLVVVNALLDSFGRETYVEPMLRSYQLPRKAPCQITLADFNGRPMVTNQGLKKLKGYNDETLLSMVITNQQSFARMETKEEGTMLLIAYPVFYNATGMAEGLLALELPLSPFISPELPAINDNSQRVYTLSSHDKPIWTSASNTDSSRLHTRVNLTLPSPLDQLALELTVSQNTATAYESLTSLALLYLLIGLIVLFLVIIAAQYLSNELTRPLLSLTTLASQIARDEISGEQPPAINSRNEITQLTTTFNTMLDRLREERQTLETRVAERTVELAKTTQILNTILDNAPVGITKIVNRKLVWMNRKAEEMFQYTKDEMGCQSTAILYPSIQAFEDLGKDAYPILTQGMVYETEQELVKKDGTPLLARLIGTAPVPQDMSQGSIWLLEDISDKRQGEIRLKQSEEKFRTIANYTYAWEIWEGPQGEYLYSSPSCERITGYPAQAFIADPKLMERLIHPEDVQKWKAHHTVVHDGPMKTMDAEPEQAVEVDVRIVLPDGNIRWISHTCYGINDEKGHSLGRRISNRDISDRKQAEAALRQSEETLKQAQTVAEIGSWRFNIPANQLEWSEETYRLFGIPLQQGASMESFLKAIHPDDRDMVLTAWNAALTGAPYNIVHRIVSGDMILWVQERVTIERDSEGRPLVGIGTVQNITKQKVTEEKLKTYGEMQAILLREVNHRVKNNLIAIISMLHQEEERAKEKGLLEYQGRIQEIVWRISGLLTVHRLLSSTEWKPLPLDQVCLSVIKETIKAVSASPVIQLAVSPSIIRVDSDQAQSLALILNELSTNTIKYGLDGRNSAKITVSLQQQDHSIELIFHDDGPGLPESFQQGASANSGVGMTLIQGLVTRNLQGTISLANNNGAEIRIIFPARINIPATITKENQE